MVFSLLTLGGILSSAPRREPLYRGPVHPAPSQRMLMIRVSQESSPGAGDFDRNILGFVKALQSDGNAASFYRYYLRGVNYGNDDPQLTSNTSHVFFVNAADGLALFFVNNTTGSTEGDGGTAATRWDLSGGTAAVLLQDDEGEVTTSHGGTVFTTFFSWAQSNTDGMVVGALPVGCTLLGQFTAPPSGLEGGWEVISEDGAIIRVELEVGRRVRLDVALHVNVRQDP